MNSKPDDSFFLLIKWLIWHYFVNRADYKDEILLLANILPGFSII